MKNQVFKVGDKVTLTNPRPDVWGGWAKEECKTGTFVVSKLASKHHFDLEGCIYTHLACQFELVTPSRIVIILRREADDRSIRKALEEMGVVWGNGDKPTSMSKLKHNNCRALIVYSKSKTLYWSSAYGKYDGARTIRKKETRDGNPLILNTKPSVRQTINELKRIL